jgi:hypothetical protein
MKRSGVSFFDLLLIAPAMLCLAIGLGLVFLATWPFLWLARCIAFSWLSTERKEALKRLQIARRQREIANDDYIEYDSNRGPLYDEEMEREKCEQVGIAKWRIRIIVS